MTRDRVTERFLELAPKGNHGVEEFVLPQVIGRSLLMAPNKGDGRRDVTYHSAEEFWCDVLDERLIAERIVILEAMRVFEWFPRNPGLFHTDRGRSAREEAQHHILSIDAQQFRNYVSSADAPPDHASLIKSITQLYDATRAQIFTPRGKMSMLQGGVGCVRYKPVDMKSIGKAWFMSASSGLAPDEGIPLLVPDEIYQDLIDRIRARGFAPANLRGRIRFIPEEYRDYYSMRHGIPRLYVEVEEMKYSAEIDHGYGVVSIAASFAAEINGKAAIYAAYATFDPGHKGGRRSAVDWLEEEYVRGLYKGEMLTDFDQQSPSFSDALFSLDDVMTSPDLATTIFRLRKYYGRFNWSMLEQQSINFTVDRRDMRMKIHIGGDAKNVVIGGHGSSNSLVLNHSQLQQLTHELGQAKQALKSEPDFEERDRMIGALADAEAAAKEGDQEAVTSALKRLKPFKDKAVDLLEKVGVGVAVAAIRAAIGF
jgi:hypothetical protein